MDIAAATVSSVVIARATLPTGSRLRGPTASSAALGAGQWDTDECTVASIIGGRSRQITVYPRSGGHARLESAPYGSTINKIACSTVRVPAATRGRHAATARFTARSKPGFGDAKARNWRKSGAPVESRPT